MEKKENVYLESQKKKKSLALNLLKAKPETWSKQEQEVYKDKTLINILMTNRMCLIKELDYKAESNSGIMLVKSAETKPLIIGMVVSIAPDCRFGLGIDGSSMPAAEIKAGDIITYAVYNGDELQIYGERLFRIRDIDIHGKIPESQLAEMIVDRSDNLWTIRKEMTYNSDNPNNIGPESAYHIDHAANKTSKKQLKLEKLHESKKEIK